MGRGAPPVHTVPVLVSGTVTSGADLAFHLRAVVEVRLSDRAEVGSGRGILGAVSRSAGLRAAAAASTRTSSSRTGGQLSRGGGGAWRRQALGLVALLREERFAPLHGGASHALTAALATRCVFGAGAGVLAAGRATLTCEARHGDERRRRRGGGGSWRCSPWSSGPCPSCAEQLVPADDAAASDGCQHHGEIHAAWA